MRRYWMLVGGFFVLFLALFAGATALGLPLLADPIPRLGAGGAAAALLGVGLLVVDVFLPVPSSGVMLAHGALFGVALGTLLSLAGSLGAAAAGFALGRAGNRGIRRLVTPEEHARAGALLERWGALAIVASRPVPILAETVAILAGASPMGWGKALAAALAGSLPPALLYALAGATAASLASGTLVFAALMAMAALFWWSGRRAERASTAPGA